MSSRKKQRLSVRVENDFAIVSLEDMEIWDGADLALLREALTALIERDGYRAVGVDLSAVKYIPSGFFGMLFEWYEQGLRIRLDTPQKNVEQMLWFRMFFVLQPDATYLLTDERMRNNTPNEQVEFHRREFMADVEGIDEEEVEEHIKSVRFGVRATSESSESTKNSRVFHSVRKMTPGISLSTVPMLSVSVLWDGFDVGHCDEGFVSPLRLCRGISDINLTIEPGEIFGFLGPNGAGKSTTIRVLVGLLPAGSGSAHIFGKDCWADGTSIRRDVGYVAGDVRLYPWLTTRRGLCMLSRIHHRDLLPRGMDLADRFRLEPDLPVRKMSRGNRQKVALVLAMAHSPKLLILDEPTSGLDPLMQDTLIACLRDMSAGGGTVMFSSHTLSEVESLCDHIAIVRDGRIVEDSTLAALKAQAPRQIVMTLRPDQNADSVSWPSLPGLTKIPETGATSNASPTDSKSACLRGRILNLELHGTSTPLMQWAATQNFEDIMIGPPSLEILFRRYYETSSVTTNTEGV